MIVPEPVDGHPGNLLLGGGGPGGARSGVDQADGEGLARLEQLGLEREHLLDGLLAPLTSGGEPRRAGGDLAGEGLVDAQDRVLGEADDLDRSTGWRWSTGQWPWGDSPVLGMRTVVCAPALCTHLSREPQSVVRLFQITRGTVHRRPGAPTGIVGGRNIGGLRGTPPIGSPDRL